MPHTPYPLLCNIWAPQAIVNRPNPPVGAPAVTNVPCFLQPDRFQEAFNNLLLPIPRRRILYMAKGTDVRLDASLATLAYIECPAGTSTFYAVLDVIDYNKGTASEERAVTISPQAFPMPLP